MTVNIEGNTKFITRYFQLEFWFKWITYTFLLWLLYKILLTKGWI